MNQFIGLNYADHPEVSKEIVIALKKKLESIIGKSQVTQDWVDIILYYTSDKYTGSRENAKKEFADLLSVY
jgi:hypothetical protein